jgi:hypothetical protein
MAIETHPHSHPHSFFTEHYEKTLEKNSSSLKLPAVPIKSVRATPSLLQFYSGCQKYVPFAAIFLSW